MIAHRRGLPDSVLFLSIYLLRMNHFPAQRNSKCFTAGGIAATSPPRFQTHSPFHLRSLIQTHFPSQLLPLLPL
mgnify:CR=1 FL=1